MASARGPVLIPIVNEQGLPTKNDEGDDLYLDTKDNTIIAIPSLPDMIYSDDESLSTHEYAVPEDSNMYEVCNNNDDDDDETALNLNKRCNEEEGGNNDDTGGQWPHRDIMRLLMAYKKFQEDMNHVKKRKTVWQSLSLRLAEEGILRDAAKCQRKWLNLTRSYKKIKDNNKKTGRGALKKFKYYNDMEKILGKKPSCKQPTQNSTLGLENFEVTEDVEQGLDIAEILSADEQMPAKKSITTAPTRTVKKLQATENMVQLDRIIPENNADLDSDDTIKIVKKKKTGNRDFFHQKLEFLKEKEDQKKIDRANKEKRHTERMQVKQRRFDLEEMKIAALQKLASPNAT